MSKSKIIIVITYLFLVVTSLYNFFSFDRPYDMEAKLSSHVSSNLKTYIMIMNDSNKDWVDVNIVLEKDYFLHIDKINNKSSYNAFLWEFLPIDFRPNVFSINLNKFESRKEILNKLEKKKNLFVEIYIDGGYYNKKL